jgi:hypothetical protein
MPRRDIEKIEDASRSQDTIVYAEETVAILERGKSAEGTIVGVDDLKPIESKTEAFHPTEVLLEQGYIEHSGVKNRPTREAYLSVVACFLGRPSPLLSLATAHLGFSHVLHLQVRSGALVRCH